MIYMCWTIFIASIQFDSQCNSISLNSLKCILIAIFSKQFLENILMKLYLTKQPFVSFEKYVQT